MVSMELPAHRVSVGDVPVALSRTEAEVLRLLMRERGRCVSRRQLGIAIAALGAHDLDALVQSLRARLATSGCACLLSAGGLGYRLAGCSAAGPVASQQVGDPQPSQ